MLHASPPVGDVHRVALVEHALVQHAPALQAPLVHVLFPDSYTQFCASFAHVASVDESAHLPPIVLPQTGSVLHVHEADPAVPVQLRCGPQAAGMP